MAPACQMTAAACRLGREEQWLRSMPVVNLFAGLSRKKALVVDMSVFIEKKALTTLFTVATLISPNISISKLSLR